MITSRTQYEQLVLQELQDIPEAELPKVLKLLHFFKQEFFGSGEPPDEDLRLFWESFGSWQDSRTAEEIIRDIYGSRTTTERTGQL